MTLEELATVKKALLDAEALVALVNNVVWRKRNQQALKIVTLKQVKLHNGGLKNGKSAKRPFS